MLIFIFKLMCLLAKYAFRYLFRNGLCCRVLKLSSSSLQKLDMVGSFLHLQKLNLDFCTSLTTLHKDCFSHMPNLKHLSMCETRVANLWTTTVSLAKLPSLVELRFQNCLCCEETGPCPAYLSNKYGVHLKDITSPAGTDTCVDNQQRLSLRDFPSDSAFGLEKVWKLYAYLVIFHCRYVFMTRLPYALERDLVWIELIFTFGYKLLVPVAIRL